MKKSLSIFVFLCIVFYSCKKNSNDNTVTPVTTHNDSIYLSKFVALDTTQAAALDTVDVEYYMYDAQHRIIKATLQYYETGVLNSTNITQYYYNGSDTLPFKSYETYDDASETSTDTEFFQYVAGSRNLSFDSSISYEHNLSTSMTYNDSFVNHYAYFGDLLQAMHDSYTSSGHQTFGPSYKSVSRQNGNITLQLDSTSADYAERYSCTYDAHPNPYYNVAWYSNQSIVSFYKYFPDSYGLNNNVTEINNTVTQISTSSITGTSHYKYTYKYRDDGYPLEIIMQNIGSTDPANVNKMKYFYTN